MNLSDHVHVCVLYRASQARLVQRGSKVMLVNKEQGDHLGLQEPRDRKEDRYAELVLSNYASNHTQHLALDL